MIGAVDILPAICAAPNPGRTAAGRGLFHAEHGPRTQGLGKRRRPEQIPALFRPPAHAAEPCSTWNKTPPPGSTAALLDLLVRVGGVEALAARSEGGTPQSVLTHLASHQPQSALTHLASHQPQSALTDSATQGSQDAGRVRGRAVGGLEREGGGFRWGSFKGALTNPLPPTAVLFPSSSQGHPPSEILGGGAS